jgi:PAS domain S-box-containing protein
MLKSKSEFHLFLIAVAALISFWFIDAISHYYLHQDQPVLSVLPFDERELSFRLLFSLFFLLFVLFTTRAIRKKQIVEEELRKEIQERGQAVQSLQDSHSRLKAILNNIPDIAWLKDDESRFILVNEAFGRACGFKPKDLVGRTDLDVWTEDLAIGYRADDREVMDTGSPKQVEEPLVDNESNLKWIETIKTPIFNDKGEVIGTTGIARDVTERRRTIEELGKYRHQLENLVSLRTVELKKTNEQLRKEIIEHMKSEEELKKALSEMATIMETVPDMLLVLNLEGKLVKWNAAAERISGFGHDELKGKYAQSFFPDGQRPSAMEGIKEALGKGYSARELILVTKSGLEIPMYYSAAALRDETGADIGLVCIGKDLSERKRMEEDLQKTEKLESLAILAGGIAHDFNNLLTAILGDISVLKSREKSRKVLTEAEKAVYRAKDLTRQLLTFSKGGEPLKKVAEIAGPVRDAFDFALRGSNVKSIFSIPADLRAVRIDEGQINQVFHNLAINAHHAMPRGGVIRVRFENVHMDGNWSMQSLEPGIYIRITVQDEGVGIPEENLGKIFYPYYTTKEKGSGLGLATAYSIIKKHGGSITVKSEIGKGSEFSVYLPATDEAVPDPDPQGKEILTGKGRVLVMDDEDIIRIVIGAMLDEIGYQAEFAENGEQALDIFARDYKAGRTFDAVLIDLTVKGGMGGLDCIKRLMVIDPSVKAIVSSGYSGDMVLSNYREFGFKGIMTKPYQIEDLSAVLHEVINDSN